MAIAARAAADIAHMGITHIQENLIKMAKKKTTKSKKGNLILNLIVSKGNGETTTVELDVLYRTAFREKFGTETIPEFDEFYDWRDSLEMTKSTPIKIHGIFRYPKFLFE